MPLTRIEDLEVRLAEILPAVGSRGVLIAGDGSSQYALMPLDDDVLDLLLERDPAFAEHCQSIRAAMQAGQHQTHEAVRKLVDG
jgi:hypothetical protein